MNRLATIKKECKPTLQRFEHLYTLSDLNPTINTDNRIHQEFTLPEGESAAEFAPKIDELPGIAADPPDTYTCMLFDSFDGRIYAKGWILAWIEQEQGGELQLLSNQDGSRIWRYPAPKAPGGFDLGIDNDDALAKLRRIMGLRALLPIVELEVDRRSFRWIDDEDKTHVRVHVEDVYLRYEDELIGAGSRLLLQPLRGYEKTAQKLQHRIAEDTEVEIDDQGLYASLMRRQSVEFSRRAAKLNVELTPEMRADAAVFKILAFFADVMDINEAGMIAALDTEFLHDYRIAVRRTRSLLGQSKKIMDPEEHRFFKAEFAWLGEVTSPLRDLDVYLLYIPEYQASLPQALQGSLGPVKTLLKNQQKREQSKLIAALRSKRYRTLKSRWREFLARPLPGYSPVESSSGAAMGFAQKRIYSLYQSVISEGTAIDQSSPAESLHELRKTCKKLRYLIECFQSLFPARRMALVIREMKQLQDNLGEFQDLDVQIDTLQAMVDKLDVRKKNTATTLLAMGSVLGSLQQRKAIVRSEFEERFAKFSSKRNRRDFKKLFKADKHRVNS